MFSWRSKTIVNLRLEQFGSPNILSYPWASTLLTRKYIYLNPIVHLLFFTNIVKFYVKIAPKPNKDLMKLPPYSIRADLSVFWTFLELFVNNSVHFSEKKYFFFLNDPCQSRFTKIKQWLSRLIIDYVNCFVSPNRPFSSIYDSISKLKCCSDSGWKIPSNSFHFYDRMSVL